MARGVSFRVQHARNSTRKIIIAVNSHGSHQNIETQCAKHIVDRAWAEPKVLHIMQFSKYLSWKESEIVLACCEIIFRKNWEQIRLSQIRWSDNCSESTCSIPYNNEKNDPLVGRATMFNPYIQENAQIQITSALHLHWVWENRLFVKQLSPAELRPVETMCC